MTYKVSIDAGHGMNTAGKRTPKLTKDLVVNGNVVKKKGSIIHEFEFNIKVAKALKIALNRCGIEAKIVNDTTGEVDTPLSTRSSRANSYGSDLHISCHYNAVGSCASFQTKAKGLLVLKTKGCQSKTSTLANCVHNAIKGNYSHDYGVGIDKNWSGFTLAILRQTNMPAILIEYGFMDYEEEAIKMLNPNWYEKLAEDTCKGICKYLDITYKIPNNEQPKDKTNKFQIVTLDKLNVRKTADWNAEPVTTVKKGQYLDVIEKVEAKNGSTPMYKLESGLYITASNKYVKEVK